MAARTKGLILLTFVLMVTGGLKASGYHNSGYPDHAAISAAAAAISAAAGGGLQPSANQSSAKNGPPARRIISLVPALTEMLFAIGAGPQVIAVSSYDEFPAEVKALPRVGALLDPDVERILALRPDLVLTYGSQDALEAQLARSGIRAFSYRHAGIEGLFRTMRELGGATGHAEEANRKAQEIAAQLDAVRARVRSLRRPLVLLVFGRQPQTLQHIDVSGGIGFLHEMLEIAGGANVFADVPRELVQPSHEVLLTRAPELILELRGTRPVVGPDVARERAAWAALASIPAVRNGRVHFLNGDHLMVPGPRIGAATEAFAKAIHPEAFR